MNTRQKTLAEIEDIKKWDKMSPAERHQANLITEFGKVGYSSPCGPNTVDNNKQFRGLR